MVTHNPVGPRHGCQTAGWATKFSNSAQARVRTDRQTKQQGSFSPSPQARGLAHASARARNTRTGGGRPWDRTNLVMVPPGGVLGTAKESETADATIARSDARHTREDENEEERRSAKANPQRSSCHSHAVVWAGCGALMYRPQQWPVP
jgi:hypothetical protein